MNRKRKTTEKNSDDLKINSTHPSSLIPHPSSLITHNSSLITHNSSLITHPSSFAEAKAKAKPFH